MNTETHQPRKRENSDFGLPQVEFGPIPQRRSCELRIAIIFLLIILAVGATAGAAYWFFHHAPISSREEAYLNINQSTAANTEFIEDKKLSTAPMPAEVPGNDEKKVRQTADQNTNVAPKTEEDQPTIYPTKNLSKGTITKINAPQGYYYIVAGSFVDDDLAVDYAKKLVKQGIDVTILIPKQDGYFFRVAVAQEETHHAARKKLEELKSIHGSRTWIKKY